LVAARAAGGHHHKRLADLAQLADSVEEASSLALTGELLQVVEKEGEGLAPEAPQRGRGEGGAGARPDQQRKRGGLVAQRFQRQPGLAPQRLPKEDKADAPASRAGDSRTQRLARLPVVGAREVGSAGVGAEFEICELELAHWRRGQAVACGREWLWVGQG